MENAVEALKIAFGVMMFVLALTLSVSSFSKANSAVTAITRMNDRETEYTYVQESEERFRIVGVESIVPTIYRAYYEKIIIKFFDVDGDPLTLYYNINRHDGTTTSINYLDANNYDKSFLDKLLEPGTSEDEDYEFEFNDGLYNFLTQNKFKEELGEYNDVDNQRKTRVITYTIYNE